MNIPDDSRVEVKVGSDSFDGNIVATTQFEITIAVKDNIGDFVSEATISADATALLKALSDQWGRVENEELSLNEDLILKLLNHHRITFSWEEPSPLTPTNLRFPNAEQKEAVSSSLGNEVTFIWGPPGTGKTTTLAWVAEAFLSRQMSVLVVAHTNVAVDKAIIDIAKVLKASYDTNVSNDFHYGKMFRFGVPQLDDVCHACKSSRREGEHSEICVMGIVRKRSQALQAEHDELASQREQVAAKLQGLRSDIELWQNLRDAEEQVRRLTNHLNAVQQKQMTLAHRLEQLTRQLNEVSARLDEAERAGRLKRLFYRLNPERVRAQRDRLADERRAVHESLAIAQRQVAEATAQKRDTERRLSELRAHIVRTRAQGLADETSLQREVALLEEERRHFATRLNKIEARLSSIEEEVLREARLIVTTLTKAYLNKTVCSRTFDAVIADEASMAMIPALCFSTGLSKSKVVIVGDFRQLAPIAIADDDKEPNELVRKWLRKDVFDHAGIIQAVESGRRDHRLIMLRKQYRMHPSISQIPSSLVYQDNLDNQRADTYAGLGINPFPGAPLVLVDTSDVNPWCSHDPNYSRFNIYTAAVAAGLARQVINDDLDKRVTVGITTPYAVQAKLIRQILESWGIAEHVDVRNVHKYQGNERDVIIFDMADGPSLGIGKPLQGGFGSDAMRLINVAITRPKSKLVVIANRRYCLPKLSEDSTLRKLLELLAAKARVENSRSVIDSYFHPDVATAEALMRPIPIDVELSGISITTEANFYKLFARDLNNARHRVVIFTPFTARRRLDTLVTLLRSLVDAGIAVYIVTRPRSSQQTSFRFEDEEALEDLESVGVKVIYKWRARNEGKEMHEKIAIIDDRLVWFGSLNIGSHSSTSEGMMRIDSPDIAREFNRIWFVDELINLKETEKEREANLESLKRFVGQQPCPSGHPMEVKINRQDRSPFLACPNPNHRHTARIQFRTLEAFIRQLEKRCEDTKCPRCTLGGCGGVIVLRWGRRGNFLSCEHYPDCKRTVRFSALF